MPVIREAVIEDCLQVGELQRKFGIEPDDKEDWQRLWVNNPVKYPHVPIGWIIEEQGKIVGFLGNVARRYILEDKIIKAVAARGWVVEPEFRNMTFLLLAKYLNQKNVDILLNSSSNDTAYSVFIKMGSQKIPLDVYGSLFFWITNGKGFIKSVAAYFNVPRFLLNSLAFASTLFTAIPIMYVDNNMRRKLESLKNRYELNIIDPIMIGTDFDLLWQAKRNEKRLFLADRTSELLRWHFSKKSFNTSIICCYKHGKLVGYLALAKMQNGKTDFLRHVIIDLIALNDEESIIQFLIAAAYNFSRSENTVVLELLGFSEPIREAINKMKPLKRKSFPTPFTYKVVNKQLPQEKLTNKNTWYPSLFDGDSSL